MENLTADQEQAVVQLQALTNGAGEDVAAILDTVGWDVHVRRVTHTPAPLLTILLESGRVDLRSPAQRHRAL